MIGYKNIYSFFQKNDLSFWIKNVFFFIVAITSFISLYGNQIISYTTSINLISSYALFDILFYKLPNDLIVHHLLVFYVTYYNYSYNYLYEINYLNTMTETCLYYEISSVFMALQTIHDKVIPKKDKNHTILSTILQILFITTFYKYRIENFFHHFLLNSDLHNHIHDICKDDFLCKSHVYKIYMGFFGLNIYWFTVMIKILYKKSGLKNVVEKINHSFFENILTYTLFITSLYMIYLYTIQNSYKPNYKYDIIGTFILGIASMIYHNYYAYFYKNKDKICNHEIEVENESKKIVFYTLIDQICIKIRSFLMIYSLYGNSIQFNTSFILHLISAIPLVYYFYQDYEKIIKNKKINTNDPKEKINLFINHLYKHISIYSGFTFVIDNIFISLKDNHNVYCKYNALLAIIISSGFFVKPFYEANQLYIHVLLILQSIVLGYICL
jgi:hypothetical protein